jgi:hypothetical protein
VYFNARYLFGTAALNLLTANIQVMLVNANYTPLPGDQYVSAISPSAIIARDVAITSPAINSGTFKCIVPAFDALLNTAEVIALVMYQNTSDDTTSPLIYYTSTGPGFPFYAQGLNYLVAYDQSSGGFFQP